MTRNSSTDNVIFTKIVDASLISKNYVPQSKIVTVIKDLTASSIIQNAIWTIPYSLSSKYIYMLTLTNSNFTYSLYCKHLQFECVREDSTEKLIFIRSETSMYCKQLVLET
jgi:hypothetical protein